jgi:heme-degrading monooxygenase HmoA
MTFYSSGRWSAKEGEEDDFVREWTEFARWLGTFEGAGTPRLARDATDAARFVSFADWTSYDAMRAWKSHPDFPARMSRVRQHTTGFQPEELELVVEVEAGAPASDPR